MAPPVSFRPEASPGAPACACRHPRHRRRQLRHGSNLSPAQSVAKGRESRNKGGFACAWVNFTRHLHATPAAPALHTFRANRTRQRRTPITACPPTLRMPADGFDPGPAPSLPTTQHRATGLSRGIDTDDRMADSARGRGLIARVCRNKQVRGRNREISIAARAIAPADA